MSFRYSSSEAAAEMKLPLLLLLTVASVALSDAGELKEKLIGLDSVYDHDEIRDFFILSLKSCRQIKQFTDLFGTPEFADLYRLLATYPEAVAFAKVLRENDVDMKTVLMRLTQRFVFFEKKVGGVNCFKRKMDELTEILNSDDVENVVQNFRDSNKEFAEFMSNLEHLVNDVLYGDGVRKSKEYAKLKQAFKTSSGIDLDVLKKESMLGFFRLIISKAAEMSS